MFWLLFRSVGQCPLGASGGSIFWLHWLAGDYRHSPVSSDWGDEWDVSGGQTGASGSGSEAPLGCCEGPATLRQDAFIAEGLKVMISNHSIQRTGASRLAQFVTVARWRLAPAADAGR
jgi:hypothetical protein